MDASEERVYHYHADANALGGVLTHPYKTVISTAANSSLSNAGGYNSSPSVPYHLDHVLHCDKAYTHTTGGDEDDYWGTLTTAVVENVNLLEVVTADKIVAQISTKHPKAGKVASVSFVGSQFVNLRVNGQLVEPALDLQPFPLPQNGKSPKLLQVSSYHHKDVRKLAADQSRKVTGNSRSPDWVKRRYGWLESAKEVDDRGHLLCSLVKEIRSGDAGNTFGHVIHVPGFGNVFLGEITVYQGAYHLTMVRAEMGCASSGTVSMASTRTNGLPYPP
jgi:hypothetical protein